MVQFLGILGFFFLSTSMAFANCSPEDATEQFIGKGDYGVYKNLKSVEARFQEVYQSGRRLKNRAYQTTPGSFQIVKNGETIPLPASFIAAFSRQLELALERSYADFLFYPDLGHAHLLIPSSSAPSFLPLAGVIANQDLHLLYHTAELIELKEGTTGPLTRDPWLQWRYYSRNFLSAVADPENLAVLIEKHAAYNTVRTIADFTERGRIYMSASKDGCFPIQIKGKTFYFDFTLE